MPGPVVPKSAVLPLITMLLASKLESETDTPDPAPWNLLPPLIVMVPPSALMLAVLRSTPVGTAAL